VGLYNETCFFFIPWFQRNTMVSVYLRIKPGAPSGLLTVQPPNTVTVGGLTSTTPTPFTFDRVLESQATQAQVYETVARPLIADVLSGYNVTICSYGQTSSGKTFTTFGNPDNNLGYAFRATAELMERMEPGTRIAVSCLEIYMEQIHDLLGVAGAVGTETIPSLPLRELPNGGVYVPDLTKRYVRTQAEIQQLWRRAESQRAVAATLMNNRSSRSHCILQLSVEQPNGLLALFNVVDLAGSERVKRSGATGTVLHEAQSINKSLFTLARVINLLSEGGAPGDSKSHIPYRDSKLTRLLQDSLGGTAKTAMIITVLGEPDSAEETLSSLRFAVRCKSVFNKPKVNLVAETLEACQKRLAAAEAELARLKQVTSSVVTTPVTPPSPCLRCEQLEMELEVIRGAPGGGGNLPPEIDWEKVAVKIPLPHQLHSMAAPELRQLVAELEAAQKFMKMRQQILYNAVVFRTHIIQNLEKKVAAGVTLS